MNTFCWIAIGIIILIIIWIGIDMLRAELEPEKEPADFDLLPQHLTEYEVVEFQALLKLQENTRQKIYRFYEICGARTGLGPQRINIHKDGTITKRY